MALYGRGVVAGAERAGCGVGGVVGVGFLRRKPLVWLFVLQASDARLGN